VLHCHHRRTKPRPQSSTYTELAAYTAEDGLLCVRLETTLLSHARWPGAVYQNRTKGQRALPVPAVQWLLCRFSTAYFVEIDNFEPFSESLHINGRNFPDVFIRSRLRMTPINHETFYGNRSTRFPKIRITDTQMDRRGNFIYKKISSSLDMWCLKYASGQTDIQVDIQTHSSQYFSYFSVNSHG